MKHLTTEEADDLRRDYGKLLEGMRRPRSIYRQAVRRDVLNAHHTAQQLNVTLKDTMWDDLEDAPVRHRCSLSAHLFLPGRNRRGV